MITGFSGVAALSCCRGYGLGPLESEKFVPNAWGETLWRTGGIGFVHYRSGCAPWVWGITLGNAPLFGGWEEFHMRVHECLHRRLQFSEEKMVEVSGFESGCPLPGKLREGRHPARSRPPSTGNRVGSDCRRREGALPVGQLQIGLQGPGRTITRRSA